MTDAESALEQLKQGNYRFVDGTPLGTGRDVGRARELAGGQQPFAAILCCADSRVPPEIIFDTGLGDLFVVRVAGNIANPSTIASFEFAVAQLGVRLIVVMGHQNCFRGSPVPYPSTRIAFRRHTLGIQAVSRRQPCLRLCR